MEELVEEGCKGREQRDGFTYAMSVAKVLVAISY
jgi:hypothetical protein